jgi:hyperosmotically inducible periplasmic protein
MTPTLRSARRPIASGFSVILVVALVGCGHDGDSKPTSTVSPTNKTASDNEEHSTNTPAVAVDNASKNKRDDGTTTTPLDQGLGAEDTAITQAVRKAVLAEKNMSVNAQNVKIVTKDGAVTLRGPVATSAERDTIADLAQKIAGVRMVYNQLEIVSQ